jgi:hypothetical protein
VKAAFIGLTLIVGLPALGLALAYALGARPATTVAAASPAVPAAKTEAPSVELTVDMRSCLARSWFPVVLASSVKPKLHSDDKGDDGYVMWKRIFDKCDVRAGEVSAAMEYVVSLLPKAKAESPPPALTETHDQRPKKLEVCGPDRWQKDHWEPSCR